MIHNLSDTWRSALAAEFRSPYWASLTEFVRQERQENPGEIYPAEGQVFAALNAVEPQDVKVVLLGQDPYHGPGQAHGLSFSVLPNEKHPPSLRNIFRELHDDLDCPIPEHGTLTLWSEQGVLLLNSVLTVRHKQANSHRKQGWEKFTDSVIRYLDEQEHRLVFLLWGAAAHKKGSFIDREKHCVLESVHPSPLSAHRGFLGSRPFSNANTALRKFGYAPIDWELP